MLDEQALVDGARKFNYVFDTRTPSYVEIVALGETLRYEILNVIEFTSARKRMSVIVKTPEGKIKIFCKGADSVIYERLMSTSLETSDLEHADDFRETTLEHLEAFATNGLRTLCFATAEIPENVYQVCILSCFGTNQLYNNSISIIFHSGGVNRIIKRRLVLVIAKVWWSKLRILLRVNSHY